MSRWVEELSSLETGINHGGSYRRDKREWHRSRDFVSDFSWKIHVGLWNCDHNDTLRKMHVVFLVKTDDNEKQNDCIRDVSNVSKMPQSFHIIK